MDGDDPAIDPGADQFPGEPPVPLSRADLALVRRAAKGRWPIPDAFRRRICARLGTIIASDLTSSRTVISAAKTFKELDALNLEQERRDQKIPDYVEHSLSQATEDALARVYGRPSP